VDESYIKVKGQERFLYRAVDSAGQCQYLNNIVEQVHRNLRRRTWLAKGYGSVATGWRTLRGIEAMDMIGKGRVSRVAKGNAVAQVKFIGKLFGIAA
jgi:transposase-like protein